MKPSQQRRMAMSRQMLKRRIKVKPAPPSATTRPLTDAEQRDLLEHDVDRLKRKRP